MPLLAAIAAAAACLLGGCSVVQQIQAHPKVAPPAIAEKGVLRAGVDFGYPPFAGADNGQKAGLDIDVAAALADRLGLKLSLVQVKPSEAASALASGRADVVLSVPLNADSLSSMDLAGTYASDGPAFFSLAGTGTVVPSMTVESLGARSVGAQRDSASFWALEDQLGEGSAIRYSTLREAFGALSAHEVQVVAGDALVGAYIARDTPGIRLVGQLAPAVPLGVAVRQDNTVLGHEVSSALDGLTADGVLDTIRAKWLGQLPRLKISQGSLESTATTAAP